MTIQCNLSPNDVLLLVETELRSRGVIISNLEHKTSYDRIDETCVYDGVSFEIQAPDQQ